MRKMPRSPDSLHRSHLRLDFLCSVFEGAQVVAIKLDRQLALYARHCLFHVV